MWTRSLSKVFKGIGKEAIWERWSDVNSWHEWIPNVEACRLDKPFESGNSFTLKPKGSSAVKVRLLNVRRGQTFTGCTHFFGATMYDTHEIHQEPGGVRLTVTLKVKGPLGFLWRKLVAEKMEANLPTLLKNLASASSASTSKKPVYIAPQTLSKHPKPKLQLITSEPQKQKSKPKKAKKKTSKSTLKPVKPVIQTSAALTSKVSTKSKVKKPKAKTTKSKVSTKKIGTSTVKKSNLKTKSPTASIKSVKSKPKAKTTILKKAKPKTKSLASKVTKSKTKTSLAKKPTVKAKVISKGKPKTKTKVSTTSQKTKSKATTKPKTLTKTKASKSKAKTQPKVKSIAKSKVKTKAQSKTKTKTIV